MFTSNLKLNKRTLLLGAIKLVEYNIKLILSIFMTWISNTI